jgi:hypothetical protein
MNIDLLSIDDEVLTSILAVRYEGCGKNMPRSATALRSIGERLSAALDEQRVSPAQRAGRRAFYRGNCALRTGVDGTRRSGGLVAFVQFRFGADGHRLFVESLGTAVVAAGTPEMFIADVFTTPATIWIDGARPTNRGRRPMN